MRHFLFLVAALLIALAVRIFTPVPECAYPARPHVPFAKPGYVEVRL